MQAQLKTNTPLADQMREAAKQRLQAQTEAPGVLRTGETADNIADPEKLKSGQVKTYYHQVPGASSYMPDGLRILFAGGQFTTDDPEIIHELDKVVNRGTSLIGSQPFTAAHVDAISEQMAVDARGSVATLPGALPIRSGA